MLAPADGQSQVGNQQPPQQQQPQHQHHHSQRGHQTYNHQHHQHQSQRYYPQQQPPQHHHHHHHHPLQPPPPHHHHHHNPHHQQQHLQSLPQPHHHHTNNIGGGSSGKYSRANNPRGDNHESNENHVLLITVINPLYPINCDLINHICSPYGKVNRIVIFKKNGIQAMVEFDNLESAKRAKGALYGCEIYSGCCRLRIEFAKPTKLNVHKNDNESFDYTNPNLATSGQVDNTSNSGQHASGGNGGGSHHSYTSARGGRGGVNHRGAGDHYNSGGSSHQSHHSQHSPAGGITPSGNSATGSSYGLGPSQMDQSQNGGSGANSETFHHLSDSRFQRTNTSSGGGSHQAGYMGVESPPYITGHSGGQGHPTSGHNLHHAGMYGSRQDSHHHQHHPPHHHHQNSHVQLNHSRHAGSFANASNALMAGHPSGPHHGAVMMVYGLNSERLNCERLFNLFCLYGNIVKIKFLKTKEGCAMVQMSDLLAVDRCVNSLNKVILFGNELQISYSKQAFLHDVTKPYILPDGSPSYHDFIDDKNNRFKNPEVASKNRILSPSQVLHFFNAPYGITEEELVHLFKEASGHEPVTIKIFTPKADNAKSFSGIATFKDSAEATEALVLCNHLSVPKAGAPHPYILRLCFSSPPAQSHSSPT